MKKDKLLLVEKMQIESGVRRCMRCGEVTLQRNILSCLPNEGLSKLYWFGLRRKAMISAAPLHDEPSEALLQNTTLQTKLALTVSEVQY